MRLTPTPPATNGFDVAEDALIAMSRAQLEPWLQFSTDKLDRWALACRTVGRDDIADEITMAAAVKPLEHRRAAA